MGGGSPSDLSVVGSAPWNGLETAITLTTSATHLQVVAVDAMGINHSGRAPFTGPFASAPPAITMQPVSQTVAAGSTAVFRVGATGGPLTYSWNFSSPNVAVPAALGLYGVLSGTTGPTLVVTGAQALNEGSFTCTVSNSAGSVTSSAATLATSATPDVGRLINVSCRSQVGTGADVLITGFAVGGAGASGALPVLIRATGPSLAQFGVPDPMADPELQLFYAAASAPVASDAGWAAARDRHRGVGGGRLFVGRPGEP